MNFEAIKFFMNEKSEQTRYDGFLKRYKEAAMKVQTSLANINNVQSVIYTFGLALNLMFSACDCFAGVFTPGDFVFLQALFLQVFLNYSLFFHFNKLAGPLFFMGTILRELDESQVHFEELAKIYNIETK